MAIYGFGKTQTYYFRQQNERYIWYWNRKNVFDEEIKKIELPDLDNLPDNIMVTEKPYLIQRRDIDINGHLHNVSYLEAALEAVPEDIYKNVDFNYIRIEYKRNHAEW